jgi:hypothetical protein
VYYCDTEDTLKACAVNNGMLSQASQTSATFAYPGLLPSVSANGSSNGIVWAIENTSTAVLHAFSAGNLSQELYNSDQAPKGRDNLGSGNKFITPMIADGEVFAGNHKQRSRLRHPPLDGRPVSRMRRIEAQSEDFGLVSTTHHVIGSGTSLTNDRPMWVGSF